MLVVKGNSFSRAGWLLAGFSEQISNCSVNMEETLQTYQEYGAKLFPISSVLLSCSFFQFAEPSAPFLAV